MSNLDGIILPRREVVLQSIKRDGGLPVAVWCERISETKVLGIIRALPGLHPAEMGKKEPEKSPDEIARDVEQLQTYAEPIIEAGVRWADGKQAIWFEREVKDAIPGRLMSDVDKLNLFGVVMELCGFVGGPAEELRFPGGDEAGGSGGDPVLGDGIREPEGDRHQGNGAAAVSGAPDVASATPGL